MEARQESQKASSGGTPSIGWEVYSIEGLPLGRIDAVREGCMHVDAPMQRDYWLRVADAVSTEQQAVTLAYPKDALDQHKLDAPAAADDAIAGIDVEQVLLDEEEQRAQRERMERELAEQRLHLASRGGTVGEPVEQELARMEEMAHRDAAGRRYMPYVLAAAAFSAVVLTVGLTRGRRRVHHATPISSGTSPASPSGGAACPGDTSR